MLRPLAPALQRGEPRALWSATAGIGNEIVALHRLGAPLSAIYCMEINPSAVIVFQDQARRHYPGVPVITTGDMRSDTCRAFWSREEIFARLDAQGMPILVGGWPCDGDSHQNASASADVPGGKSGDKVTPKRTGMDHSGTALLTEIGRIYDCVCEYANTPRPESTRTALAFAKATKAP